MNKIIEGMRKQLGLWVVLNAFFGIILTSIVLIVPLIQGRLIDIFVYEKNFGEFQKMIALMLLLVFLENIVEYFNIRIESVASTRLVLKFNKEILNFFFKCSAKKVTSFDLTYLHSRMVQDVGSFVDFYIGTISAIFNTIVTFFIAIFVLIHTNAKIIGALLVFVPLYIVIYMAFKNKIRDMKCELIEASDRCYSERTRIYNNYLDEKLRSIWRIALIRLEKCENSLIKAIINNFKLKYAFFVAKNGVYSFFQVGIFIIGGLAIIKDQMTLGVFTYVLQYFTMLLNTADSFLNIGSSAQSYKASYGRLCEVLELEEENEGDVKLNTVEKIELIEMNYKYSDGKNWLYDHNISCCFEKGKLYTIVGKNGSGKSTLLMIMAGLYKESLTGRVSYNDLDASSVDTRFLRDSVFSIMPQKTVKYELNVNEYIQLISNSVDIMQIIKGNKLLQDLFGGNEYSIELLMGKSLCTLSGGELQLLNLLLCLAKPADVYLLDEPLSFLHKDIQKKVINLLQQYASEGKMVIAITHNDNLRQVSEMIRL